MLMVDIALFTLGAIVAALAPAYGALLGARVLVGLGLGGEVSIGITVISEISPTHRRGAMTASLNFVTGGLGVFAASGLATLFFGPLASPLGGVNVVWRWWFALMVIPALLLFWYRRYIPESPRYLLQQGRVADTNRVLTLLHSNRLRDDAAVPTHEFVAGVEGARPRVDGEKPGLGELFRGGIAKRTIIAWLLAPASFSVMVAMIVFMPTVLNSRGLDTTTSLVYTTFTTFGGVVGAVLGIFVSHRLPRKVVLAGGGLVNALLGIGFYLAGNIGIALGCAFTMEMIFYVMYPVVAVYLTEMFPTRIRGLGTGSAWFLGLVASGLGSYAAGALLDTYGSGGVFVAIALMCVLIAAVSLVGPETRGRSLDSERLV
jgi:MFS family permease